MIAKKKKKLYVYHDVNHKKVQVLEFEKKRDFITLNIFHELEFYNTSEPRGWILKLSGEWII